MRRNIIYILVISLLCTFSGCSDSYEDATSKHVYGENENPYLRVDQQATVTTNIEFAVERLEPYVLSLEEYNELFREKMGMSVDQVIAGLGNGSVVFYNINTARNHWNKTGKTKGTTGWYYNSAGGVATESDNTKTASLDIDTNNKTLTVTPIEGVMVGTTVSFNVGFAVNGPDYDDYVRFAFNVSYSDPSTVMVSVTIPAGDYASYGIDLNNYAETIDVCMGMTVEEFLANMDTNEGKIHMYVVNPQSGEWDETSNYTANAPGYWMDNRGAVCNWGATGFSVFAEMSTDDKVLYIGRAPDLVAGNQYTISIGYKDTENENKFFRFIITITLG